MGDNPSQQQDGPFNTGNEPHSNPDPDNAIVQEGAGDKAWSNAEKLAQDQKNINEAAPQYNKSGDKAQQAEPSQAQQATTNGDTTDTTTNSS